MPEHKTPDNSPASPAIEENTDASPEHANAFGESPDAPQEGISSSEERAKDEAQSPAPRLRGRRTLPASPVERARLEAQAGEPPSEIGDRTTMVAFGLLFVVPLLIILLSVLLLLPFINSQLTEDPSGVRVQSSSGSAPPSR